MSDNSPQGGTDTIRDLARQGGTAKTQVMQLDLGGDTANAEVLLTAGQQLAAVSMPVVIASNQTTLPVQPAELFITGQGSQLALNQNVLLAVAGAGVLDCLGYRSITTQINAAAGTVTAGTVSFEQSNDQVNWVTLGLYLTTDASATRAFSAGTFGQVWTGPIQARYVRARISTGVTGTTTGLQAFTLLSSVERKPNAQPVVNASASNFAVAVPGVVNVVNTPLAPTTTSALVSSLATVNNLLIKGSAGTVYGLAVSNVGAAAAFLKLYNKATSPAAGTDVPVLTIPIAASAVLPLDLGALGVRFSLGIGLAITNLAADNDTTAVAAAQVKVMLGYA